MHGKLGVSLVKQQITNYRGLKYTVLSVRVPKPGEYPKFKTILYNIKCNLCKKNKEVIHQQVSNGDHCICNCWKTLPKEQPKTREQIMKEIDDEFEFMLYLNAQDELMNYFMGKFPDESWDKILQEDE
jgi:hypothetical protein